MRGVLRVAVVVLGFAGLGGLVGLGMAADEVRAHGYLDLGFSENARAVTRVALHDGLGSGLALGALFVAFAALAHAARRALARLDGPPQPAALCALGLGAGLALLVALPEARGALRVPVTIAVVLWCGCVVARARAGADARTLRDLLEIGMLLVPAVLVWRLVAAPASVAETLHHLEVVAATTLAGLLLLLALAGRRAHDGEGALPAPRAWPLVAVWLVVAGVWAWSARPSPTLEARNPKNVVLVAVDTLRADYTALDGDASATPRLAAWASRGIRFTTAVSQSSWTLPAFASVMTGRYPRQHGAVSLFGRLPPEETTLAEVLREAGYWTGGVVSHVFVDADHGFSQGFDHFDEENVRGEWAITSESVSQRAIALLEGRNRRPFFLFLHYFDPHYAFRDHPEQTQGDDYDGWVREIRSIAGLRARRHQLDPVDLAYLRDLYAEEVAYTDAQIGAVLDRIETLGLADDTAVVFVSDHGEEFMERGWLGHTIQLHDEVVRVPLLLVLPGLDAPVAEFDAPVETRAIGATLMDFLELPGTPFDASDSLLEALGRRAAPRAAFSEVWLPEAYRGSGKRVRMTSVRTDRWKLIRDHDRRRDVLYDLVSDPGETRDASAPEARRRLEAQLRRFLAAMGGRVGVPEEEEPEDALLDQLRALGYVDD